LPFLAHGAAIFDALVGDGCVEILPNGFGEFGLAAVELDDLLVDAHALEGATRFAGRGVGLDCAWVAKMAKAATALVRNRAVLIIGASECSDLTLFSHLF